MTCDESLRMIARATEGHVSPGPLDEVVSHLESCALCCREAEAQMEVKRVLATRPFEPLPERLARRLAEPVANDDPRAFASVELDQPRCNRVLFRAMWGMWLAIGAGVATLIRCCRADRNRQSPPP
jgi:hypothetical protein